MQAWEHARISFTGTASELMVTWRDDVRGGSTVPVGIRLDDAWLASAEGLIASFLDGGTDGEVLRLGEMVSAALLPGQIRDRYDALDADPEVPRLLLDVTIDDAARALWMVPWELLLHARSFVLADPDRAVRRIVDLPDAPSAPLGSGARLRVQVVEGARRAPGTATLAPSPADHNLRLTLGQLDEVELLDRIVDPTASELTASMAAIEADHPVDVLVFDGHGDPRGLWLRDPHRGSALMDGAALAEALRGRVRVAVLLSCGAGASLKWESVAEHLARAGIAAVSCQTQLDQVVANDLLLAMANELRDGYALDDAVARSRIALTRAAKNVAAYARLATWLPTPDALHVRITRRLQLDALDPDQELEVFGQVAELIASLGAFQGQLLQRGPDFDRTLVDVQELLDATLTTLAQGWDPETARAMARDAARRSASAAPVLRGGSTSGVGGLPGPSAIEDLQAKVVAWGRLNARLGLDDTGSIERALVGLADGATGSPLG